MTDDAPTGDAPTGEVVKDMALTLRGLQRGLPAAMGDLPYVVTSNGVEAGTPARGLTVTLTPLTPRRFGTGLMVVERAEVRLAFRGYDASERDELLQRFERAYQRGGG